MKNNWVKIGDDQFQLKTGIDDRLANGYCAFACRQAAMYEKLANNTMENWFKARSHNSDDETSGMA